MTESERHARAKAIFLEAIEGPADGRGELVDRLCANDRALREDVEALLRHADDNALETSTIDSLGASFRSLETGSLYAGRYRIVTQLGRGGMADVYRAEDTTLGVEVALKILRHGSPALVERLLEEVRLSRQVTHPAICRVYDIDRHDDDYFFTMELVDGEDLKSLLARIGRLPNDKVRDIGTQICEGLAAAHAQKVLHRDLKPSNIMLDGSGAIRITDFGIAVTEEASASGGLAAGTVAYMAPEQLAGEPASVRTDLYAVGLVLYEALVGNLPHENDSVATSSEAEVEKPSALLPFVDPGLEAVILSLLQRDPAARPGSATEVAETLRGLGRARPGSVRRTRRVAIAASILAALAIGYVLLDRLRPTSISPMKEVLSDIARPLSETDGTSVAVLPVTDVSRDKTRSEIAECIQDDLIDRLSSAAGVSVIAEESADRVKERENVTAVARELGAEYVTITSVDRSERGVRTTVALFEGRSGKSLWSETYDHELSPDVVHETEQRIVGRVLDSIGASDARAKMAPREPPTRDEAAYSLYVRGRQQVPPFTIAEFKSGVATLTEALEKDSRFAAAAAALGSMFATAAAFGWVDADVGYASARRYAERALALDPSDDEAHVVLGAVAADYEWNWRAAEESFRHAIRLNPSSAWAHRSYARFLSTQGRFEEAIAETGRAAELDPTSAVMLQGAAQRFYEARRYDRAAAIARVAIRIDPVYPISHITLAHVLIAQGKYDEAVEEMLAAIDVGGRDPTALARVAYARVLAGDLARAADAEAEAERAGVADFAERALIAMARGNDDAAIAALRHAVDRHERASVWLGVLPAFDPLRKSAEFAALVARVGLPPIDDGAARN